jgi:hypothetical protein
MAPRSGREGKGGADRERKGELTLDQIRRDGQVFMEEVSREIYESHAGLKSTAELEPIYERHAGIMDRDALDLVRSDFQSSKPGSEELRSSRILLEWEVESQAGRALASIEEREIAWEASAVVKLDDGRGVPYQRAAIEIANSTDRGERLALDSARSSLVERELAPIRREHLERERDYIAGLEIAPDYNSTFHVLSGINLSELEAECRTCLSETRAMWDELLPGAVRRSLGVPVSELTRADALALFRAREFDQFFPAETMQDVVVRQMADMRIDARASGRIRYDTGEREGKRSRAFCSPVRIPEEVYLVMRPHGGQTDYQTLLHELGHALHFANMRADYPFEYRWAGDNSVTESYAMLFDHLLQNHRWLLRYTGVTRREMATFLRAAALEELHYLRRYCAKLIYEVELYGGRIGWESLPDLYVDTLSGATSFRYRASDAFVDVDARFYSARYLRAWQLGALLAEALTDRFDEDWFRNPKAGPWIIDQLYAEGQRELADEVAKRAAGERLSFGPVIAAVERLV